jgi:O-antigen ligase
MLYNIFLIFCAFLPLQFALNPTAGVDLAIVRVIVPALFLGWIFWTKKNKLPLLEKNKVTYLIIIFLLLAVFSLSFSHNLSWSLRKLAFLFSLAPIYFVTVSLLNTKNKMRGALAALVGGAAVVAFLGIIQFSAQFIFGIDAVYVFLAQNIAPFFLGNSFAQTVLAYPSWLVNSEGATYMRAIATFPDPHMFAYYLGMLAPWSIVLWATTQSHKKLFFFSSALLIITDILTFTRGGYIALIAAAVVILPLVSKSAAKKVLAGAAIFVLLFVFAPHNPVAGRFLSSFDLQEGSNQGRIANWQQALSVIAAHPFGVGIGMYPLTVDPNADYREPIYAHNLYLDLATELGLVAAFVFLALLFFAFRYFWQSAKKQPFFVAGVASLTVFAVHSLVENPLYSVHILPLILIIIAMSKNTVIPAEAGIQVPPTIFKQKNEH